MKLLLSLIVGFALSLDSGFSLKEPIYSYEIEAFYDFCEKYSKIYPDYEEEELRLYIFVENLRKIEEHNRNPKATYKMGVNQFADLTDKEFQSRYLSITNLAQFGTSKGMPYGPRSWVDLPKSVDWREKGIISKVKNQNNCSSCWAFAATEQIESYVALNNNGTLLELSTQQLTSCSPHMKCGGGCIGSYPKFGYAYASAFGMNLESQYPYTSGYSGVTEECKFYENPPVVAVRGFESLPQNDMMAVMDHLANVGPLAVDIDAYAFNHYLGGVLENCSYDQYIRFTHAVQLVGYGTNEEDGDYWIIRNSWGEDWGDNGYVKLKRHSFEECRKTKFKSISVDSCEEEEEEIEGPIACGTCGILLNAHYPIGATIIDEQ